MKKYVLLIVISMLMMTLVTVSFAEREVKINYNGVKLGSDVNPIIVDGRTMVPARSIFEKAGYTVKWIDETKSVIASKGDVDVIINIGDPNVDISDPLGSFNFDVDVPAQIVKGRTLIPLIIISELGHKVFWDDATFTVDIYTFKYYAELKIKRLSNGLDYNGDGSALITEYTFDEFLYEDYPRKNSNEIISKDVEELEQILLDKKIVLDKEMYTPLILVGDFMFINNNKGNYYKDGIRTDFLDLKEGSLVHARRFKVNKSFETDGKLDGFFVPSTSEPFRFLLLDCNYKIMEAFSRSGAYRLKYDEVGEGHIEVQFRNPYDEPSELYVITNMTLQDKVLYADVNGENVVFSDFINNIEFEIDEKSPYRN